MNKKEIIIAVVFFIVGILLTLYFNKPGVKTVSVNDTPVNNQVSKPLGFMSTINYEGKDLLYYINDHGIYFYPVDNTHPAGFADLVIEIDQYPDLFKQGIANSSVIHIYNYKDPDSGKNLLKITNSQPDHGGFASTFALLVNPITGEIKKTENDYESTNP